MADQYSRATLESIAAGAIPEVFAVELAKVLANIDDVNTHPTITRSITIELKMKPTANRDYIGMLISVKGKLAPIKAIEAAIFPVADASTGEVIAVVDNMRQQELLAKDQSPARPALRVVGGEPKEQ